MKSSLSIRPEVEIANVIIVRIGSIPRIVIVERVPWRLFARYVKLVFSWVVVGLDDLCEVRLTFRTGQAMLVSVPLVLALVAEHQISIPWLLHCGRGVARRNAVILCE